MHRTCCVCLAFLLSCASALAQTGDPAIRDGKLFLQYLQQNNLAAAKRLLQLSPYIDPNGFTDEKGQRHPYIGEAISRDRPAFARLVLEAGATEARCHDISRTVYATAQKVWSWREVFIPMKDHNVIPSCSGREISWITAMLAANVDRDISVLKFLIDEFGYSLDEKDSYYLGLGGGDEVAHQLSTTVNLTVGAPGIGPIYADFFQFLKDHRPLVFQTAVELKGSKTGFRLIDDVICRRQGVNDYVCKRFISIDTARLLHSKLLQLGSPPAICGPEVEICKAPGP